LRGHLWIHRDVAIDPALPRTVLYCVVIFDPS